MSKEHVRTYYFISFFSSLSISFFFATYAIFLTEKGMNLMQIGLLASVAFVCLILFEIPTGAFADIYGRKLSIVIGFTITSIATAIYYFSGEFRLFALAEIIAGIGIVFVSGALDAWMVDSSRSKDGPANIGKIFVHGVQANQAGLILGSLSGAYMGSINIALPWAASSIFFIGLAMICAVVMKEEYEISKKRKLIEIKKIAAEGIRFSVKNKGIMHIVIFGAIVIFSSKALDMQWSLVFKNTYSLDVKYLGWIFVGFSLFMILGAQLSIYLSKRSETDRKMIVLSQIITAFGTLTASMMLGVVPVLSGLFIHEIGRGAMIPLKQSYLNKEGRIPNDKRATVLSFDSMVLSIGGIFGVVVSGYLANAHSISFAWTMSGIVLIFGIGIFLRLKNGK